MNHDPTSQAPNHNLLAKGVLFLGGGLALAGVLHPTDARADSPDPISISIDVNTPLPAPEITLPDTNPGSPSPDAPAAGNPDPGLGNPSPAPADSRNNQPAAPSAETVLPDVSAPLPAPEVALPINPVQKYIPKPQDVLPQALPAPVVVVPPVPQQPISGTPVMPTVPYSPDNPGNNQAPSSPAAPGNTESDPYAGKITTSAPPTLTGPKPNKLPVPTPRKPSPNIIPKPESDNDVSTFKPLLEVISIGESHGDYDTYFNPNHLTPIRFTAMSIAEVLSWQQQYKDSGSASTAVGRYQFLESTLQSTASSIGVDFNAKFDPQMQDRLAAAKIVQRGGHDFLAGKISWQQFANQLAKEWASFPQVIPQPNNPDPSASFYSKDGLNHALISISQLQQAIAAV